MKWLLAALMVLAGSQGMAQEPVGQGLPAWLAGSWAMESGASWADEFWTVPRGNMMLGASRTGFGPQIDAWEHSRIARKANGAITLYVQPKGRVQTEFPVATMSEFAIEFSNPANDYPQRIRYERVGQLLITEISKMDGSQTMSWQYRLVVSFED